MQQYVATIRSSGMYVASIDSKHERITKAGRDIETAIAALMISLTCEKCNTACAFGMILGR